MAITSSKNPYFLSECTATGEKVYKNRGNLCNLADKRILYFSSVFLLSSNEAQREETITEDALISTFTLTIRYVANAGQDVLFIHIHFTAAVVKICLATKN